MSTEVATKGTEAEALELALLGDDLSKLTPPQRLYFYNKTCTSLGLNPLTKPFSYLQLSGKLTLYAKRDCTDQLRKIHGVSVTDLTDYMDGHGTYVVTAKGRDREGRVDASKGAIFLGEMKGEMRANAIMKAETKAKRRLTLSLCGLGMLDETEVDLPGAVLKDTDVVHDLKNAPEANGKTTRPDPDDPELVKQAQILLPTDDEAKERAALHKKGKDTIRKRGLDEADVARIKKAVLNDEDADMQTVDLAALAAVVRHLEVANHLDLAKP
jgi:hypothetical protein